MTADRPFKRDNLEESHDLRYSPCFPIIVTLVECPQTPPMSGLMRFPIAPALTQSFFRFLINVEAKAEGQPKTGRFRNSPKNNTKLLDVEPPNFWKHFNNNLTVAEMPSAIQSHPLRATPSPSKLNLGTYHQLNSIPSFIEIIRSEFCAPTISLVKETPEAELSNPLS